MPKPRTRIHDPNNPAATHRFDGSPTGVEVTTQPSPKFETPIAKVTAPVGQVYGTEAATVAIGDGPSAPPPAPLLDPCPAFLLMAHPARWVVLDGGEGPALVPLLGRLILENGVSGVSSYVDRSGQEHIRAKEAIESRQQAGWTIIPHDVDGPGTTYLRRPVGCERTWLTRFERVFVGTSGIEPDLAGYVRWLRSLMPGGTHPRAGLLPHPRVRVLHAMAENLREQAENAALLVEQGGRRNSGLAKGTRELRRLEASLAAVESELAAAIQRETSAETQAAPVVLG